MLEFSLADVGHTAGSYNIAPAQRSDGDVACCRADCRSGSPEHKKEGDGRKQDRKWLTGLVCNPIGLMADGILVREVRDPWQ